jgi:acyl-[acyl-carrier-protein]-phospholipid O-acyltransferase / long-chain-fatty-acid--[acyl-carrier-protein] ligase
MASNTHSTSPKPSNKAKTRTFWALVGTMFQGAFSDNIFKLVLMMLALHLANAKFGESTAEANSLGATYQLIVNLAFTLPWILAVAMAGWLSDRFSKSRVTQWTKAMEIVVMVLAFLAFSSGSFTMAVGVMFLMALQSALFSPSKYGILPEILPTNRVGWGNGVLQGFTFISILLGTIVGPFLFAQLKDDLGYIGVMLVGLAIGGLMISSLMTPTPVANKKEKLQLNPLSVLKTYGEPILKSLGLRWAITGYVVFWGVAIMLQTAAIQLIRNVLGISELYVGLGLIPLVIGNGLGCFLASYFSRHSTELGLVPVGAIGVCLAGLTIGMVSPLPGEEVAAHLTIILPLLLGVMGLFCGMFVVPLQSYILEESDPKIRGGIWATSNLLVAFAWTFGSIFCTYIIKYRGAPADVFTVGGIIMLLFAALISIRFSRILLRFMVVCVINPFYKIRFCGLENIPRKGGALLTPNHQSYLDGLILVSVIHRPVRFIMSRKMYHKWFIFPFAWLTNSIPIEQDQTPRELITTLRDATNAIKDGSLVCIFPEGQLTRIGIIQPLRRGLNRIMKGLDAPIIPVAINGAYDTRWGLKNGMPQFLKHRPSLRQGPISVSIGDPLPSTASLWDIRQAINHQLTKAFEFRRREALPLHRMGIKSLRENPLAKLYGDHSTHGRIPNFRYLAAIALLGNRLKKSWKGEGTIGLLLPPSIGTAAINIAALAAGKVPVNLNYSASTEIIATICETAGIKTIITSKEFLRKSKCEVPEGMEIIYTEYLRKNMTKKEQIEAMLRGVFQPLSSFERWLGREKPASLDDTATLVFSSGSTGIPKGVMLSHWNIWANVTAALQYVPHDSQSVMIGALPFFHSFGYTAGLWLPLRGGLPTIFYPSPLDGKAIGDLVEKEKITHFFATPTFLASYIRRVSAEQFNSLSFVMTGAEKLRDSISIAFEEKYGVRVIEGYGATECSPIVCVSRYNLRMDGVFQEGNKRGSIGQAIPGLELRITDIDSGELLPVNKPGLMWVKGHCVMQGYYKMEEKTNEVMDEGWYQTGDVARIDEDGFVFITDRLTRFSKIAGEMVPHIKIEEALQQAANASEPIFAVAGVPDEKRGERLIVLYTLDSQTAKEYLVKLSTSDTDLPNLWIPRWNDCYQIEEIPLLGSGKMDLKAIKMIAQELGK